jgi:hypothetical protein
MTRLTSAFMVLGVLIASVTGAGPVKAGEVDGKVLECKSTEFFGVAGTFIFQEFSKGNVREHVFFPHLVDHEPSISFLRIDPDTGFSKGTPRKYSTYTKKIYWGGEFGEPKTILDRKTLIITSKSYKNKKWWETLMNCKLIPREKMRARMFEIFDEWKIRDSEARKSNKI